MAPSTTVAIGELPVTDVEELGWFFYYNASAKIKFTCSTANLNVKVGYKGSGLAKIWRPKRMAYNRDWLHARVNTCTAWQQLHVLLSIQKQFYIVITRFLLVWIKGLYFQGLLTLQF